MDLGIKIKRSKVVWRQVADQVRKKILSKQLTPGTKLPSTAEMAAQIGTDVPTLHRALTELVCEGLITRTPRIGTHVAQWEKGLLRLGIYHSRSVSSDLSTFSHRVLEAEVQKAATALKISVQVWTDSRPHAKQNTVLPVIEYAARERIIQALVSTDGDEMHRKWLMKLPLPVSFLGSFPGAVIDFDHGNFFEVAAAALAKQGCRSVAYLGPQVEEHQSGAYFQEVCQKLGLTIRPEWTRCIAEVPRNGQTDDAVAYHGFKRLWEQPHRPDGIIVYPDIYSNGVVMAILEQNIRVPRDLKVVLHRNHEVTQFCPFEATFVTSRFSDAARAIINQLDTVLKGREPKQVLLQHAAVKNEAG